MKDFLKQDLDIGDYVLVPENYHRFSIAKVLEIKYNPYHNGTEKYSVLIEHFAPHALSCESLYPRQVVKMPQHLLTMYLLQMDMQ